MTEFKLPNPKARGEERVAEFREFAAMIRRIDRQIGFRVSSRGWCYQLEGFGLVTKAEFDRVEGLINDCRKEGLLPVDFTAEEEGRKFSFETADTETVEGYLNAYISTTLRAEEIYVPDLWNDEINHDLWEGEEYYIQILVEKIDLKTLFTPICKEFNIPIATSKGWSSILQRAEYAHRFKEAEENGKTCLLLYCGDHDPDGLRISHFLRENLEDVRYITWRDDTEGYDPEMLQIKRFGLDYDFIEANKLTWIDNLITGSKRDLGSPSHPNHNMAYVQNYIKDFGKRKCEANAIVVRPDSGRKLCRDAIEKFLGEDASERFRKKRELMKEKFKEIREGTGVQKSLEEVLKLLEG